MKKPKTDRIMAGRGLHLMARKLVNAAYGRGYRAARLHYKKLAQDEVKAAYERGKKAAR
jgi:hypothetical protein